MAMKAGMGKAIGIGVAVGAIAATIAWFCAPKEVDEQ